MDKSCLIYCDETAILLIGDAVITLDYDPKLWTCETYGQDHSVTLDIIPSWADAINGIESQKTIILDRTTLKSEQQFTLKICASSSCSAEIYPEISVFIVVQQAGAGTFVKTKQLNANVQDDIIIKVADGKIIEVI